MADLADQCSESNAAERAVLDRFIVARDYKHLQTDATGERCDRCHFPLKRGYDKVGRFCSILCQRGGTYQ